MPPSTLMLPPLRFAVETASLPTPPPVAVATVKNRCAVECRREVIGRRRVDDLPAGHLERAISDKDAVVAVGSIVLEDRCCQWPGRSYRPSMCSCWLGYVVSTSTASPIVSMALLDTAEEVLSWVHSERRCQ